MGPDGLRDVQMGNGGTIMYDELCTRFLFLLARSLFLSFDMFPVAQDRCSNLCKTPKSIIQQVCELIQCKFRVTGAIRNTTRFE